MGVAEGLKMGVKWALRERGAEPVQKKKCNCKSAKRPNAKVVVVEKGGMTEVTGPKLSSIRSSHFSPSKKSQVEPEMNMRE